MSPPSHRLLVCHLLASVLLLGACSSGGTGGNNPNDPNNPDNPDDPYNPKLIVTRTGDGDGTVSSKPNGIECGKSCISTFIKGTVVTLTATPDADSAFGGWSGGTCTGVGTCELTLDQPVTAIARFDKLGPPVRLQVTRTGAGTAAVYSEPAGIDCGGACSAEFRGGTTVTLRVATTPDSYFAGWSKACTGVGPCQLTLRDPTEVGALFAPRVCPSANLCWDSPFPHGGSLLAVFGFDNNDVWAGGNGGVLMRWNGVGWTQTTGLPGGANIYGLWGSAPDNIFAASQLGRVYRYNGTSWQQYQVNTVQWTMYALWGSGPNDVWVGGDRGGIYRWNGTSFSGSNGTGGTLETFTSLWGGGPTDVWAISRTLWLRYNGSSWTTVAKPAGVGVMLAVSGTASNDVWLVGENGGAAHFDGTTWRLMNVGTTSPLRAVLARAADEVWAFSDEIGVVYRYDGTTWSKRSISSPGRFISAWAGPGTRAWAVGGAGATAFVDKGEWVVPYPAPSSDLFSASGRSENDIWAVGAAGAMAHYDGFLWKNVQSGVNLDLHAVWQRSKDDVWVGGDRGTVLRLSGGTWKPVTGIPTTLRVNAISGSGPNDVWFATESQSTVEGALYHFDGSVITLYALPFKPQLKSVVAVAPGEAWATGGSLIHLLPGKHEFVNVLTGFAVGLWAASRSDIWLVQENGLYMRYDGTGWSSPRPTGLSVAEKIIGTSPGDVFVIGENGALRRWNGNAFQGLGTSGVARIFSLWGTSAQKTWIFGVNGAIYRLKP